LETYQLDINNSPNHLHGGYGGFSTRDWEAAIVNDTVHFTLVSLDGDQGYPAGIEVIAIYSLKESTQGAQGAQLHLSMSAMLLPGETKATAISLAQHSYFNLASHSASERIMNHVLTMPNCHKFTPVDETSIPTREVLCVNGSAMDFRHGRIMSDALIQLGQENGFVSTRASCDNQIYNNEMNATDMPVYGFDHNYVINQEQSHASGLYVAAVLEHPPTGRSLIVHSTAPGVQVYSSNYLNGMNPLLCKERYGYRRWQGICLETQTYPDCITEDSGDNNDEFVKGRCFVLVPGGDAYYHCVVFEFTAL
jgi:aldose 1-epimerase